MAEVVAGPRATGAAPLLRKLRLPFALVGLVLQISWGLLCAVLLLPWLPESGRTWLVRIWSRMLVAIVGVRLEVHGDLDGASRPPVRGRLLVGNHISWLDVYAIDAVRPARFIAKSDIADWPVIGWLVTLAGTLYVERGRRHAVAGINRLVGEHLSRRETIAIFPEGTTSDGSGLLRFHANLIQPALEQRAEIRPLAIRYTQDRAFSDAASYAGETTLWESLIRILLAPGLTVSLEWLPPIEVGHDNRHAVAHRVRDAIAQALGISG